MASRRYLDVEVAGCRSIDRREPSQFVVLKVFATALLYSLVVMFLARSLVVPTHYQGAADGDIPGDPVYYQRLAKEQLQAMQSEGLRAFHLRPSGSGPAGIASLAYYAWEDPLVIIAINSVLHAIGVTALLSMMLIWFGRRTALVAIIPALLSPYSMVWFSQLNKDSFVFAGSMLFSLGVAKLIGASGRARNLVIPVLLACLGVVLIGLVRPYVNRILLVALLPLMLGVVFRARANARSMIGLAFSIVLLVLGTMSSGAASDRTLDDLRQYRSADDGSEMSNVTACLRNVDSTKWQGSNILPQSVDDNLRAMAGQRCLVLSILDNETNATTLSAFIDQDIYIGGTLDAVKYVPRALQIGMLAPWPDYWQFSIEYRSPFYLVSSIESAMLYVGLLALVVCLIRMKRWSLLAICYFALVMFSAYGMTTPFLGALYRYRYPWWIMLICIGIASMIFVVGRDRSNGLVTDRHSSVALKSSDTRMINLRS